MRYATRNILNLHELVSQVKQMHIIGRLLAFAVPPMLAVMNVMWFWKILKGLKKTLAKRQ